jgi:hypothetical protein
MSNIIIHEFSTYVNIELLLREFTADETEDPGMMNADEGAVTEIRVDIIILREAEIRIVQIRDEGE